MQITEDSLCSSNCKLHDEIGPDSCTDKFISHHQKFLLLSCIFPYSTVNVGAAKECAWEEILVNDAASGKYGGRIRQP